MPSPVRVFVITTQGPLEIKQILCLPEDTKASHVFLTDGSSPLWPISSRYNEIVRWYVCRLPTIPPSQNFSLFMSEEIEEGQSWELPVLVAHAVQSVDKLAGTDRESEADTLVFATGRIDRDLAVQDVGNIEDKLKLLLTDTHFLDALSKGRRVIVAVPQGNAPDGRSEQERIQTEGATLVLAPDLGTLLDTLKMPMVLRPADPDQPWEGSPFRGLEVFESSHRKIFCGRGKAREEALRILRRQSGNADCRFLLIHGSSGVGKSSLARAGLLGDIEQEAGVEQTWRSSLLVPNRGTDSPLSALADGLLQETGLSMDGAALLELMRSDRAKAASAVRDALGGAWDGSGARLVLLVDQLEDLLLWAHDRKTFEAEQEREAFADMLGRLARSGRVWVIATLRTDLLPLIEDSPALSDLCRDDRLYRLERPRRSALKEIITHPAQLAGVELIGNDPDGQPLVDVLVDTVGGHQDALPLLQFALKRLYDDVKESNRTISYDQYYKFGRLENAIGDWAEETVAKLCSDAATARALDDIILNLGRRGPDGDVVVANQLALEDSFLTPARETVIRTLSDARLIVLDTGSGRRSSRRVARVAHEALLTHWPRARQLFDSDAAMVSLKETLERDAKRWNEHQDDAFLIPGGLPLEQAQNLLREDRLALSKLARDYIDHSVLMRQQDILVVMTRLTGDEYKVNRLIGTAEFEEAESELRRMVGYLGSQIDPDLKARGILLGEKLERIAMLARFQAQVKRLYSLSGEEEFEKARETSEQALRTIGKFDEPRWLDRLPVADLSPGQIGDLRDDVYRTLLLFSALQLMPGVPKLFPPREAGPPRPNRLLEMVSKLLPLTPNPVAAAVVRRGMLPLPKRRDSPEALADFANAVSILDDVWKIESAREKELGRPIERSRASFLVQRIAEVLQQFASGPKDGAIDFGQWIVAAPPVMPEPVNAVDYFLIGLFNYFIAKRSRDGATAKLLSLVHGTFPDLDPRAPLATAERLLRKAVELEPRNYWAHWVLGRTLMEAGAAGSAELAFNAAILLQPDYARGYEQRALALGHQWRECRDDRLRERALTDSGKAAELANGDPSIFWPRGELLETVGDIAAALDSYALWLELEEAILDKIARGSGVNRLYGLASEILKNPTMAPRHADAGALLALAHWTWKRFNDALPAAEDAVRADPRHPHALTAMGVVLCDKGEYERALREGLDLALTIDPFNYLALRYRARACKHLGWHDKAASALSKLLVSKTVPNLRHRCPPWMLAEAGAALNALAADDQRTPTAA